MYTPRCASRTVLHRVAARHLDDLVRSYPLRFQDRLGPIRAGAADSFRSFLRCGVPQFGFAHYRCPACDKGFIVPFSCQKWLCPSCTEKRKLDWAIWLTTEVLFDCPHFFCTLTVPPSVRAVFRDQRGLVRLMVRSAADVFRFHLEKNCEKPGCKVGVIAVPQTFGSKLDFNPHVHMLVTARGIHPEGGWYATRLPHWGHLRIAWRSKVLSLLLNTGAITRKQMLDLRARYPKGFNVHVAVPGKRDTVDADEVRPEPNLDRLASIARYLLRAPFAESRSHLDPKTGEVTIRFRQYESDTFGKLVRARELGTERLDPVELLARLAQHQPDVRRHRVTYYGAYATRFRGRMKALCAKPNATAEGKTRIQSRQSWRSLIWRVYESDPLACPGCGTEMKRTRIVAAFDANDRLVSLRPRLWFVGEGTGAEAYPWDGRGPPGETPPSQGRRAA